VSTLRERKKLQTRRHIADTACRLFVERGFDAVTVDEVAQAAEVSKKTVFNYFPTKEDLIFHRSVEREVMMVALVRERAPGVSLAEAFRDQNLEFLRKLAQQPAGFHQGGLLQVIKSSPTLERRLHAVHAHQAHAVARELADLTHAPESDPLPLMVAHTLLGAHRSLFKECHRLLASGKTPAETAAALEPHVHRVYQLLEHGFAGYALRDRPAPAFLPRELSEQLSGALDHELSDRLTDALAQLAG
jgi:AcrR family transcriptional regulator